MKQTFYEHKKKRDNILTDTLKDVLKNMVFSVIVMRKLKGYKPKISDAWFRYEGVVYDRNI